MITVFAARKIAIMAMLADYQFQQDCLARKRMNMMNVGMTIADGQITPDEYQQSNYYTQNGIASAINFGNALTQQSAMSGQPVAMVYRNPMNPNVISIHDKAVEQINAQLAAQEKQIDMQLEKLSTQIKMLGSELDEVKSAENESIKRNAPKYTANA